MSKKEKVEAVGVLGDLGVTTGKESYKTGIYIDDCTSGEHDHGQPDRFADCQHLVRIVLRWNRREHDRDRCRHKTKTAH